MAFTKGMKRPANAGRKKGDPNRATVRAACIALKVDPIEIMCLFAADEKLKPEFRGRMAAELAEYMYPKLKAIEHSGPGGTPIEFHDSARAELASRIAGLAARIGPRSDSEQPK